MKLKKVRIHAFRNIEHAELSTGPRFNILYGNNAQGKTNLLESIYLLGTMKSFKLAKNRDLVKWGNSEAVIRGWIDRNDVARDITVIIDEHGKKARIDNKALHKLSEFFGMLNVVVFSPEEIAMVRGMPEIRR